jgi:tetratricopeptide (TPR) repeat protein
MKSLFFFIFNIIFFFTQILFAQNAEDFLKKGNQKYKEQSYVEAIENYQKALKINPKYSKALHNLGNVYYRLGEAQDALKYYNLAIQYDLQNAEPYISRGILLLDLQKIKEAENDAKTALKFKPDMPDAHFLIGNIKNIQGKKQEACKYWKIAAAKGHALSAENTQKYCNLNNTAKNTEKKDNNENKKSNKIDYVKLGEEELEKREYRNALDFFEKALELDKKNAKAYFGIGGAKFAQGDEQGACEAWKKALELGYKKAQEMIRGTCQE